MGAGNLIQEFPSAATKTSILLVYVLSIFVLETTLSLLHFSTQ